MHTIKGRWKDSTTSRQNPPVISAHLPNTTNIKPDPERNNKTITAVIAVPLYRPFRTCEGRHRSEGSEHHTALGTTASVVPAALRIPPHGTAQEDQPT